MSNPPRRFPVSRKTRWQQERMIPYVPGEDTAAQVREQILNDNGLTDRRVVEPFVMGSASKRGSKSARPLQYTPGEGVAAQVRERVLNRDGLTSVREVESVTGSASRKGGKNEVSAEDFEDDLDDGEGGDEDLMEGVIGGGDDESADDDQVLPENDDDLNEEGPEEKLPENDDDLHEEGAEKLPESDEDLDEDEAEPGEAEPVQAPSKRMPIFEPKHNIREAAKQLLLLEDHLSQPEKFCPDCIRKHLLGAEAFAEEAITLDRDGSHQAMLKGLPDKIRGLSQSFLGDDDRQALAQRVRVLRKELSKIGFDAIGGGTAPTSTLPTPPADDKPKVVKRTGPIDPRAVFGGGTAAPTSTLPTPPADDKWKAVKQEGHVDPRIRYNFGDAGFGFLPLLIAPVIKAGKKFVQSPKGQAFLKQVTAKKNQAKAAAVAAPATVAPTSPSSPASHAKIAAFWQRVEDAVRQGRVTEHGADRLAGLLGADDLPESIVTKGIPAGEDFLKSQEGRTFLRGVITRQEKAARMGAVEDAAFWKQIGVATAQGRMTERAAERYAGLLKSEGPLLARKKALAGAVKDAKQSLRELAFGGVVGIGGDVENGQIVAYVRPGFRVGTLPDHVQGFPLVACDTRGELIPRVARPQFGAIADYAQQIPMGFPVLFPVSGAAGPWSWRVGIKVPLGVEAKFSDGSTTRLTENPTDGEYVIQDKDSGAYTKAPVGLVLRRPLRPISDLLRGRMLTRFGRLNEDQLRMADVIQAVFEARLPDICGPIQSSLDSNAQLSADDKAKICKSLVPDKVLKSAVINALFESKLDSNAIGDNGNSVGLFQLNENGAGSGMSVEDRQNPIRNTERILEEFSRRLAESPLYKNLLVREMASILSKNPAIAAGADAYTDAWTKEVERPADPAEGERRAALAREAFPTAGQQGLYDRYVAPMVEPVVKPVQPFLPSGVRERLTAPSTAPVFGPGADAAAVPASAGNNTVRNVALGLGGLFFAGTLALSLSKLTGGL